MFTPISIRAVTPVSNSVAGTTTATTATLPAAAGMTTYLAGFSIGATATAAAALTVTVTNVSGGTMNFQLGAPAAPAIGALNFSFNPPLPATGPNVTIPVQLSAAGIGGVTSVTAWGFQAP